MIANSFVGLCWGFYYILEEVKTVLNPTELNIVFIDSIACYLIYYIGFGLLPVYVFDKLKLTNVNLPPDFDKSDIDEDDVFKNDKSSSESEEEDEKLD